MCTIRGETSLWDRFPKPPEALSDCRAPRRSAIPHQIADHPISTGINSEPSLGCPS